MGMEKQQKNQEGLILQYDKRRFDGGPEMEQIRLIEAQQALLKEQQQQTGQWHYAMPAPDSATSIAEPSTPLAVGSGQGREAPKAESSPSSKVRDAILVGPLSLGIGAVGIFTACLAIVVAYQMNNPALLTQGRTVLAECGRTLQKGMVDTVSIPYRLLKAVSTKA
jgi:hypothetical protein